LNILIEAHYLPCIAYFAAISGSEQVILEKHENFTKQTYRNRCQLIGSQGRQVLTIPLSIPSGKCLITDVRIDYRQNWVNNHWRTIQSAYGKAPFFEYYQDDLRKVFDQRFKFLYDLNLTVLSLCLGWLKSNVTIKESLSYVKIADPSIKDLRSAINPKNDGIMPKFYQPVAYTQVFGNAFVDNASIIDLIFCVGPEAARIIKLSTVTN
jgi:WbqC-like protein family